MCTLNACPHCGREAREAVSRPWFPVYTCLEARCGTKYCPDEGPPCPECGSFNYREIDQVHPWVVR